MSVKVLRLSGFGIHIITAVTQEAELVERNARYLAEYHIRDDLIERDERDLVVAVRHEEGRNGAGEAAQVVADGILDGILLAFLFLGLDGLDRILGCLLYTSRCV